MNRSQFLCVIDVEEYLSKDLNLLFGDVVIIFAGTLLCRLLALGTAQSMESCVVLKNE